MTRLEAQLTRAIVSDDGRIKANFEDNSVLLLDSTGSTFTFCTPDGGHHRQLSAFAVRAYERKLALVLDFRNSHTEMPFHCRALRLLARSGPGFQAGFPLKSATWPSSPTEAAAARLLDTKPDGCLVLRSHNDTARMILLPHSQRLVVTFPLHVDEGPVGEHRYVWQTQTFWVSRCPVRWLPALRVLLEAAGEPHSHLLPPPDGASMVHTPLPKALTGGSPSSSSSASGTWGAFKSGTWWTECSTSLFPEGCRLLIEWRPEATYHWFGAEGEARLVLHHDGSTMATFQSGKYFRHSLLPASLGEAVYAANAVPRRLRGATAAAAAGGGTAGGADQGCDLAAVAAHAALFREAAARLEREAPAASDDSQPSSSSRHTRREGVDGSGSPRSPSSSHSSSVREVEEEPGVGRFTSYEDGRVRAVFRDRTILELDASGAEAELLLPDATRARVSCSSSSLSGPERRYVAAALSFRSRSFATAEQRAAALRLRAGIEAELAGCGRVADMLSFAITGDVPEVRAGGAGGAMRGPEEQPLSPEEMPRPQGSMPQPTVAATPAATPAAAAAPAAAGAHRENHPERDEGEEQQEPEPGVQPAATISPGRGGDGGGLEEAEGSVGTQDMQGEEQVPAGGGLSDDFAGGLGGFQGQDLADLIRQHLESSSRMLEKLDPLI